MSVAITPTHTPRRGGGMDPRVSGASLPLSCTVGRVCLAARAVGPGRPFVFPQEKPTSHWTNRVSHAWNVRDSEAGPQVPEADGPLLSSPGSFLACQLWLLQFEFASQISPVARRTRLEGGRGPGALRRGGVRAFSCFQPCASECPPGSGEALDCVRASGSRCSP